MFEDLEQLERIVAKPRLRLTPSRVCPLHQMRTYFRFITSAAAWQHLLGLFWAAVNWWRPSISLSDTLTSSGSGKAFEKNEETVLAVCRSIFFLYLLFSCTRHTWTWIFLRLYSWHMFIIQNCFADSSSRHNRDYVFVLVSFGIAMEYSKIEIWQS